MERGLHDPRWLQHRRRVARDHRHETTARADRDAGCSSSCAAAPARSHDMKIAVVGAGAIGGYLGGWLSAAGEDVTFIARGANLEVIGRDGMRVIGEDGSTVTARPAVHQRTSDAGPQDVVILAVKAHQVSAVA